MSSPKRSLAEEIAKNEREYAEVLDILKRQLGNPTDFDGRAKRYMSEHGVSYERACRDVAREDPEGYRAYRNATFLDGRLHGS